MLETVMHRMLAATLSGTIFGLMVACGQSAPVPAAALDPPSPAAGDVQASPLDVADPPRLHTTVLVTGMTLRVPEATFEQDNDLRVFLSAGSGVIQDELRDRLLSLARTGSATLLSAPTVVVRSGERASVSVEQSAAALVGQSKSSLLMGVTPTAREGGIIDLEVEAGLTRLDNGVEVALADWGMPIGRVAKGRAVHRLTPPQTVFIARVVGDEWYVWLAEPRVLEQPAGTPGP
jgi:hypothetical protein